MKKSAVSGPSGKFFDWIRVKLSRLVGPIWKPFKVGYEYGRRDKRIEANQERIDANNRLIQSLGVFIERANTPAEETSKDHDTPYEMSFFIGNNRPVLIAMSPDFWTRLQLVDGPAWSRITKFVDAELERRDEEGEI